MNIVLFKYNLKPAYSTLPNFLVDLDCFPENIQEMCEHAELVEYKNDGRTKILKESRINAAIRDFQDTMNNLGFNKVNIVEDYQGVAKIIIER